MDWSGHGGYIGTFVGHNTHRLVNGSRRDDGNDDVNGATLILVSLLSPILYERKNTYVGAGVTVTGTVVVQGIRRYALQKEDAGGPNFFKAPKAPVTTLQSTFA